MRSFIGVELDHVIKEELAQLQERLRDSGADVKWVRPGNIHLTLKFLGNVAEERISEIASILDNLARNNKPFAISLFKVGCFPRLESPRVVWVGIDQGCSEAERIADTLEDELEKLGFLKEKRKFSAHLTLGRVRSPKNRKNLVEKIKALDYKSSARMNVCKLTLFKSTLTSQGSIYTALHEANLNKD